MKPGARGDYRNMLVTRISHYERLVHHEELRTIWRYAFRSQDGQKFVYSGTFQPSLHVGDTCAFRATVKQAIDKYGFIRLARLRVLDERSEKELELSL